MEDLPPPAARDEPGPWVRLALLAGGVVIFLFIVWRVLSSTGSFPAIQNVPALVLSAVAHGLYMVTLVWRLGYYLEASATSGTTTGKRELIQVKCLNQFFATILPHKISVPVQAYLLHKICRVNLKDGVGVTFLEFTLDAGATLLVGTAGLFFFFIHRIQLGFVAWVLPVALLGFLVAVIFFFTRPSSFFDSVEARASRLPKPFRRIVRLLTIAMRPIHSAWWNLVRTRRFIHILLFTIANFLLSGLLLWAAILSFGVWTSFPAALTVVFTAHLIGIVSGIPGGLGVREGVTVFLLRGLGVPSEVSLSATLLQRFYTIPVIAAGLGLSYRLRIRPRFSEGPAEDRPA